MTLAIEPETTLDFDATRSMDPSLVETILLEIMTGQLGDEL